MAELAIVAVILGSIAALAIPNILIQKKRICNSEGEMILRALSSAQKEYSLNHGVFATESVQISEDFAGASGSNSGCFYAPVIESGAGPWIKSGGSAGAADYIVASVQASDGSYTLYGTRAGTVECFGNAALCAKMGYGNPSPVPSSGPGC